MKGHPLLDGHGRSNTKSHNVGASHPSILTPVSTGLTSASVLCDTAVCFLHAPERGTLVHKFYKTSGCKLLTCQIRSEVNTATNAIADRSEGFPAVFPFFSFFFVFFFCFFFFISPSLTGAPSLKHRFFPTIIKILRHYSG